MERLKWRVVNIIKETEEAYSFILVNEQGMVVPYEAGQFLTFIFRHRGIEIRRSYSISSTPGVDKDISITVKRKTNGEISRQLINHVQIGDQLTSIYPAGRFMAETNAALKRQFFFIAAGSGIVPVFSLIKKILKYEPLSKIILIYQNHHQNDIIFKDKLNKLETEYAGSFKCIHLISNPASKEHLPQKLNNHLLEKLVTETAIAVMGKLFFLCGPVSFMRMAQFTLRWMGFTVEQIKKENFTVDHIPAPPAIYDTSTKKITIHFNNKTYQIETSSQINILQAALNKNIELPYSCRSGRCSNCVAKCIQGKIVMSNNEVLTDRDIENGLVLTCVAYAETDAELEW
ncbi:MAG TPA: iron-sulfur cluster-binding domain-containing protein [Puia sp.]|nr:iron-sulfur cluster-binding domain-containing protein [Puia sp.]